jgi:malate dehydrogenase (oxaloacetate-decarboxylating)
LILGDRPGIEGEKAMIAADPALVRGWSVTSSGAISLADVVKNHRPTILIGASGQPGTFTESILRAMRRGCPRPIVLPISNPTAKAEATPADILDEQTAITGRPGEPIYPPLARLRDVSFRVAVAVGQALVAEGAVAPRHPADVEERVRAMVWDPVYRPYRPA